MRKILLTLSAAAVLSAAAAAPAQAGCYRLGLTGYHWYRFCAGPSFLYPHHRTCYWKHGYRHCWVH